MYCVMLQKQEMQELVSPMLLLLF
uniref:Uncharacterized protein n=1 Tax=Arundo donax TaxID=35708 RepID=A0A0A9BKJ0_ARUDO